MDSKIITAKVKKDYDLIGREFSETRRKAWKDFDLFLPFLSKKSARRVKILDLGCGNGRLLDFLQSKTVSELIGDDFDYLGVDQSKVLLAQAKHLYPKFNFFEADFSSSKGLLKSRRFDFIFAIASFHHLPPAEHERVLKQWNALLKKDGVLFMTNWNLHQPRFWKAFLKSLWGRFGFRGLLIPWKNQVNRYYYAFTEWRLKRLLKKSGFHIVKHLYVDKGEKSTLFRAKNIVMIAKKIEL